MIDEDILDIILLQNEDSIRSLNNEQYTKKLNELQNNNTITEDLDFEGDYTKIDNTLIKKIKEDSNN